MDSLVFATTFGRCSLGWGPDGVRSLRFLGTGRDRAKPSETAPLWVFEAVRKITDHLAGRPADLASIPLDLSVLTPFQREVAAVLRETRPGETLSYGDVALRMGRPGAARAVGHAVKTNPLLLLVPCHRVVARDGEGGFSAFGSLQVKRGLRELEAPRPGARAGHTGRDDAPPAR